MTSTSTNETLSKSPKINSSYDTNRQSSFNQLNSFSLSSTSNYQSTIMNKYKNLVKSDFTHPLSTLKQMNRMLSDQQSHMNSKYVNISLIFIISTVF